MAYPKRSQCVKGRRNSNARFVSHRELLRAAECSPSFVKCRVQAFFMRMRLHERPPPLRLELSLDSVCARGAGDYAR